MDISFVLLTWNSKAYIDDAVASIFADLAETSFTFEIFVVDNGSTDGTADILRRLQREHPDTVLPTFLDRNIGTTRTRNMAMERSTGRYIVIMDSDVELHGNTIPGLVATLEANPPAGMAVPRLLYPSGTLQKSVDCFPTLLRKVRRYLFLKAMEEEEDRAGVSMEPVEVDYAISALWVIRRTALDKVGPLDEYFFYAPEDVDYCIRFWKAGFSIIYDPRYTATHHTQELSRGFRLNVATQKHVLGLLYYFKKHRYLFKAPPLRTR